MILALVLGSGLAFFVVGWITATRLAGRLRHAEQQRLERLQEHFITAVSHELRTPLTSINGSLGLLAAGLLDQQPERAQAMLRIASANAERLARVVEDVVSIERLASGRMNLERQACSPLHLVHQATDDLRDQASQRHIAVRVESALDPAIAVEADPERTRQVVRCLLDNALKFSSPGSAVRVSIEATDSAVYFRVADEGIGISADHLSVVFERFRQLDMSDARTAGGTGLGLAICKSIVEAHGGSIHATSRGESMGSTFSFWLPRARVGSVPVQSSGNVGRKLHGVKWLGQDAHGAELQERSAVG